MQRLVSLPMLQPKPSSRSANEVIARLGLLLEGKGAPGTIELSYLIFRTSMDIFLLRSREFKSKAR